MRVSEGNALARILTSNYLIGQISVIVFDFLDPFFKPHPKSQCTAGNTACKALLNGVIWKTPPDVLTIQHLNCFCSVSQFPL